MSRFDETDQLHALIDDEVGLDVRAELEALLQDDPALRARFDDHASHKAALRDAADDLAAVAPLSPKTRQLATRLRLALWGAATLRILPRIAAALLLVGVGAGAHALYAARNRAASPIYAFEVGDQRLVLDAQNLKTSRKLEIRSPSVLSREAERWLGRAVTAPRLVGQGLALVDARLMQAKDRKLVGLIYEDAKGRRVTLSIGADLDGQPDEVKTIDIDNGRADYWSDGRASYVLVDARSRGSGYGRESLASSVG